jgi:uncharacterized heparinase superfamily protein
MKLASAARYAQTLKYLKPSQMLGRIWFRLHRPKPDLRPAPMLRAPTFTLVPWIAKPPTMDAVNTVTLLNERADISDSSIWQDTKRSLLWLYNLHYLDDLAAKSSADRANWHRALINRWIAENPPAVGIGWQPYPSSLRIVNLIKWHLLVAPLAPAAQHSLAVQVRHLRQRLEHHILGNHLVANAKALYFAGAFFCGDEAEAWRTLGARILTRELKEQVLADGAHFELTPMYHLIVLEDVLDCINIGRSLGTPLPENAENTAASMLAWAELMQHPDGQIPFFNDATFGIAPRPADITEYATRLGLRPAARLCPQDTVTASGYVRFNEGDATFFADVAAIGPDYLPGHAHADTLSFELSLKGDRLVVNCGTSVYGTGQERQRQRGTAAHTTLSVDGMNSSDVWAGFRVGRRARVHGRKLALSDGISGLEASHDGYAHHLSQCRHAREWQLSPTGLLVKDTVSGQGEHVLECMFHLHPDIQAKVMDGTILLFTPSGLNVRVDTGRHASVLVPSTWHPGFSVSLPSQAIAVRANTALPATIETSFSWDA